MATHVPLDGVVAQESDMVTDVPGPHQRYAGEVVRDGMDDNEPGVSQSSTQYTPSCSQPARRPPSGSIFPIPMLFGKNTSPSLNVNDPSTQKTHSYPHCAKTPYSDIQTLDKSVDRHSSHSTGISLNVNDLSTQNKHSAQYCTGMPYSDMQGRRACAQFHPKSGYSAVTTGVNVRQHDVDGTPGSQSRIPGNHPSSSEPMSSRKDSSGADASNNSPFSVGSACSKSESWQSSSDSWESENPGGERERRLSSGVLLDVEVVDVKSACDRDLSKVVETLAEAAAACEENADFSRVSSDNSPPDSNVSSSMEKLNCTDRRETRLHKLRKSAGLSKTKHPSKDIKAFRAKRSLEDVFQEFHDESRLSKDANVDDKNRHLRSPVVRAEHVCEEMEHGSSSFNVDSSPSVGADRCFHGCIDIKKKVLCQVCGDVAAGFYCGAYTCEACKKFFVRATHQYKMKYVCHRSEDCEITKETRVRCQYCRYQKCLKLNMYSPGEGRSRGEKTRISNIPCRVCGGSSSGFHFGALTCEGCKGFFRRMAKERELNTYRCVKDDMCEINTVTRNVCKACRYKKCLDVGMSVEASRIGRQPNAVKHAISVEALKIGGVNKPKVEPTSPDFVAMETADAHDKSEVPLVNIKTEVNDSPEAVSSTVKRVSEAWKELNTLSTQDKTSFTNRNLSCVDLQSTWKTIMVHFEFNAKCIIKFSKKLPNFQSLSIEDQVTLIQMATYPLCILNHCQFFNLETHQYRFFDFDKSEENAILKFLPQFSIIPKHFLHFGEQVKSWHFDDIELALISSLVLMNTANVTLKNIGKAENVSAELSQALTFYLKGKHKDCKRRMEQVEKIVEELGLASIQHNQCVAAVAQAHSELENQLWDEMYLK